MPHRILEGQALGKGELYQAVPSLNTTPPWITTGYQETAGRVFLNQAPLCILKLLYVVPNCGYKEGI